MHVRSQIRHRLQAALETELTGGYDIFASRKYKRNHDRARPLIDITVQNVNIEIETMGPERRHTASLYVRVQRSAREDDLDDALDADEVAITRVIEAVEWGDLLEEDPELMQVNFSQDAEGESAIRAIILRYDVEYRIDKRDPETVRA